MARVKSAGNISTEAVVLDAFRERHITGWRRQGRATGSPDFFFPDYKLAVFVDGCFWHGCARHCRMPVGNRNYWSQKIAQNVDRDICVNRTLKKKGWKVIRIWEHELREKVMLAKKITLIMAALKHA